MAPGSRDRTEEALPSVRALGVATPETRLAQDELLERMTWLHGLDQAAARRLRVAYRRSRIGSRATCLHDPLGPQGFFALNESGQGARNPGTAARMAAYRQAAPALVVEACRAALASPGAPPRDAIDHVIVASCTGFMAPGLDVVLSKSLELRSDVGRTLVGFQGCQAGLAALRLAARLAAASPASAVLLACVELCTLHFQQEPTEDNLLANALFADGAAAAIVAGPDLPLTAPALAVDRTITHLQPDSLEHMSWDVGDHGFTLHLSSLIPRLLALDVRPVVEKLGLRTQDEIAAHAWAVHPGGAAILEGLARSLALPEEAFAASWDVLREHGNMSSPTVLFVLQRLLERREADRPIVALAFGPGLTVEAARLIPISP